ncbi:receptor-like protein EIX1 [Primulina huaijiensis]|uniref:receptor-like protein EIX1 n=1 Tax=Primulina huaijiensis TaxID=1492673 RepID=UPI003CC7369B
MDNKKRNAKSWSIFLVLVSMYILKGGNGEVIRCIEKERKALLKFKQELDDSFNVLSSWGSEESQKECCKWRGVVCCNMTGHVISLHLNSETLYPYFSPLTGNLCNSLFELHHLISLDLSSNEFTGKIPESIGSLDKLQHLNLSSTSFSGNVPSQLGYLTNLRTLDLGHNNGLVIQNLDWLSKLSSLFLLDLSGSNVTENIEIIMFQKILVISSLKELYLGGCNFPNHTSPIDVSVNPTSASLRAIDLSGIGLTSSTFQVLFNTGRIPVTGNLHSSQTSCMNFSCLSKLYLSDNHLKGDIFEFVGAMMSLEVLDLSHNNITGLLPESVGRLSKLELFDVSFNLLEGSISESHLSELHHLKKLDLSYNSLVLNLTTEWIPPFQLDFLDLAYCSMGPRFPIWVQTQSEVSYLDLSSANISDELPERFWDSFPRLTFLNLSHNQISGRLPDLSSKLFGYPTLDLSFNIFSGLVPSFNPNTSNLYLSNNRFFGPISFLSKSNYDVLGLLDLSNNQLSGQIPSSLENTMLTFLDLSNNYFSGKIPNSLCSESTLVTLHLRNNNLSGELPDNLKNCLLFVLDVGGNNLTGNIPAWIGTQLQALRILSIRGNSFFGSIPREICNLRQIQILDLSQNNLSGRIPLHCFKNFDNFIQNNMNRRSFMVEGINIYLDDVFVQWKGQHLEYEGSKPFYLPTLIDLSCNKIEGNIPIEIFQMEGLVYLNLSRNHLRGGINPTIQQMEALECLDLSGNQLSGEIPASLGALPFLEILDLSNNNFSGEIPSGIQLQGFNASTYAGNIGLCGSPLPTCPGNEPPPSGHHGKLDDGDGGFTNQSLIQEFYITIVLGFIVGFWGVIGTLLVKKSWRFAYFNFFDRIHDYVCLKAALYWRRLRLQHLHNIQT